MFAFTDENGCFVELHFNKGPFEIPPKHVLVFVFHQGKWLCTINKRGVEFPGGKVEPGETLEEAAIREVYEETAIHISDLEWFAYYVVHDERPFSKAVFTAKVDKIDEFVNRHETLGRIWLTQEELEGHPNLSFYMKDEGMKKMLQEVKINEREWQY
ncbi:NUDIX domain-containing protein [Lysinibacillus yapensis]|uniref:NUDIX domain-containing protein n=1 Tax=Ureibacillus yapensis TaxID=2304605 RepID=A0A396S7C6_9BACL|nr:NUDIX domain-containing protein [Lysinibacillus yapensis]RHW33270.1 NUDIX domain-containing protein [Lysinibacillus yapensis]